MKPLGTHNYFIYITTNKNKTTLYIGVTNNLPYRLEQHEQDAKTDKNSFAGKYNCYHLIYYERFQYIGHAIDREKELEGWTRERKDNLIHSFNPDWQFLNDELED